MRLRVVETERESLNVATSAVGLEFSEVRATAGAPFSCSGDLAAEAGQMNNKNTTVITKPRIWYVTCVNVPVLRFIRITPPGRPHAGSAKDPDLTSPALRYLAMMTPLGEALLSTRVKPAWSVPAANSLRPLPIVTGKS